MTDRKEASRILMAGIQDLILAHKHSSYHRKEILSSKICGCFQCLTIFNPSQIDDWVDEFDIKDKNTNDIGQTALCPYCAVDSVIGEKSGYPITKEFLKMMNAYCSAKKFYSNSIFKMLSIK